jgi:hypothetical protein
MKIQRVIDVSEDLHTSVSCDADSILITMASGDELVISWKLAHSIKHVVEE